ncbi:(d)CMP kinase [bacterium]|nr:MAG: (d)CMP kinase [bacterium]
MSRQKLKFCTILNMVFEKILSAHRMLRRKRKVGPRMPEVKKPAQPEAKFLISAPKWKEVPDYGLPFVVVAGRSNVGKSSFINYLVNRKNLARTSSTPGRTRLLNFFDVGGRFILVDVPGYGYANAPKEEARKWLENLMSFISGCDSVACVIQLLDIRRDPTADDKWFAREVMATGCQLMPVVTKADKLARTHWKKRAKEIGAAIGVGSKIPVTSAQDKIGREEVTAMIDEAISGGEKPVKLPVIALDGPSGAGKSTVAKLVAKKLGWSYLDTGAMYRAIGLKADREGIAMEDHPALGELCARTNLSLRPDPSGQTRIFLDGEDVSEKIREHRVSALASAVSASPPVREAMAAFQRRIGASTPTVCEGRDMGTVVFPDALLKIFLTAAPETRAKRRVLELEGRGERAEYDKILADIVKRDHADSTRAHSPLKQAEDAVLVDSGNLDAEGVAERVVGLVKG